MVETEREQDCVAMGFCLDLCGWENLLDQVQTTKWISPKRKRYRWNKKAAAGKKNKKVAAGKKQKSGSGKNNINK